MENCIFCKIVKREASATIELETENVVAFRNIAPVSEVHILITPKEHIVSFMDIDNASVMLEMVKVAQQLVEKFKIEGGYKLIFNGGKYQAIPHLHWHLLGGKLEDQSDVLNRT